MPQATGKTTAGALSADGRTLKANVTTYTPTGSRSTREGGKFDRYDRLLVTVEESPGSGIPYSVAGDINAPWYRKDRKVSIPGFPGVGRLCDTGANFFDGKRGTKIIRTEGEEPIDVCVAPDGSYINHRSHVTLTFLD